MIKIFIVILTILTVSLAQITDPVIVNPTPIQNSPETIKPAQQQHQQQKQQLNPQQQFKQQYKIEKELQQQVIQQQNQQLPPYIKQQIQQFTSIIELPITQTFNFLVRPSQQVTFKWNPSKQKQLKLILDVFQIGSAGELKTIINAEEYEFVEVMTRNPNREKFILIGKVYRTKMFTIDFDTDYKYIKFINKNTQTVFIQVSIEALQYVVQKGVPDDKLTLSRNKMHTILMQSQTTQVNRQHIYKWQWGFFQNEKQHQLEILGFTGIELFALIVTSFVQMFFLKRLLDNRAVV